MVEMCVRYVRKHVPSGSDVAVLGPAGQDERPMIALSVSRPEALELSDELDGQQTPRAAAFDLMIGILGAAGASVAGIEILDAPGQAAQARLQLTGPRGQTEIQVEVGPAVSLSVRIGAPLRVSDRLIAGVMPPSGAAPAADMPPETVRPCAITGSAGEPPARDPSSGGDVLADQPVAGPAHDVPEQFRRAFDDEPSGLPWRPGLEVGGERAWHGGIAPGYPGSCVCSVVDSSRCGLTTGPCRRRGCHGT